MNTGKVNKPGELPSIRQKRPNRSARFRRPTAELRSWDRSSFAAESVQRLWLSHRWQHNRSEGAYPAITPQAFQALFHKPLEDHNILPAQDETEFDKVYSAAKASLPDVLDVLDQHRADPGDSLNAQRAVAAAAYAERVFQTLLNDSEYCMAAQYAAAAHSWNHYIHAMDCYVHALVTVVANESRLRAVSELMTDYEEAHELRIPQLERDLRRLISSLNV